MIKTTLLLPWFFFFAASNVYGDDMFGIKGHNQHLERSLSAGDTYASDPWQASAYDHHRQLSPVDVRVAEMKNRKLNTRQQSQQLEIEAAIAQVYARQREQGSRKLRELKPGDNPNDKTTPGWTPGRGLRGTQEWFDAQQSQNEAAISEIYANKH